MRITSEAGVRRIETFEGLELKAYPDPGTGGEPWTIGYGHTGGVKPGEKITQADAEKFLRADLHTAEEAIRTHVKVPLSQKQFDALVSLIYNIGVGSFYRSTILYHLNAGHYARAANHFLDWRNAGGRPILLERRKIERSVFLSGSNRGTRIVARTGVR